jgi:hypothetical protein
MRLPERGRGIDDRTSVHVHQCDVCHVQAETPLIRYAPVPADWFMVQLMVGPLGTSHTRVDLCPECWFSEPCRAIAMLLLANPEKIVWKQKETR